MLRDQTQQLLQWIEVIYHKWCAKTKPQLQWEEKCYPSCNSHLQHLMLPHDHQLLKWIFNGERRFPLTTGYCLHKGYSFLIITFIKNYEVMIFFN